MTWIAIDDPSHAITVWIEADRLTAYLEKLHDQLGIGAPIRVVWRTRLTDDAVEVGP